MSGRLLATLLAGAAMSGQPLVEGLADSSVRVVIYEDLQCPDCAAFRVMMDEKLLPQFGGKVAFVHRDFPLAKHVWARRAAIAARFFAEKRPETGLAWRRHIMASIRQTTDANFNDRLAEFARSNGIAADEALAALNDSRLAELVEKDYQDGVARGVVKTPTVFVNGQPFIERFPVGEISKGIEAALAGR